MLFQYFFSFFDRASKMEIDYIFPRRIFSPKNSAREKILTEWKTAFSLLMYAKWHSSMDFFQDF